ncbi:hypothetical protein BCR42DRAFT_389145 [Absidia repens]|uniref:Uncharacterized protein n=1 Tax=Absidia repens TaxID=90262 RepID=A0A1X2ISC0_9FUNG|nr:hypothetical protein BCR42DRAFT_389145 [Absidia repens]
MVCVRMGLRFCVIISIMEKTGRKIKKKNTSTDKLFSLFVDWKRGSRWTSTMPILRRIDWRTLLYEIGIKQLWWDVDGICNNKFMVKGFSYWTLVTLTCIILYFYVLYLLLPVDPLGTLGNSRSTFDIQPNNCQLFQTPLSITYTMSHSTFFLFIYYCISYVSLLLPPSIS